LWLLVVVVVEPQVEAVVVVEPQVDIEQAHCL
jgi:hypothetical protein